MLEFKDFNKAPLGMIDPTNNYIFYVAESLIIRIMILCYTILYYGECVVCFS